MQGKQQESKQSPEARLLRAVVEGTTLEGLVCLAADLLDNPVILIDGGYRLLACSEEGVPDPLWQEILQKGYWSYDTVNTFKDESIIAQVVASDKPVLIDWGIARDIRRISTKVVAGGAIVGHLAVLEARRPFGGGEIDLLALVAGVIASELQKPVNATHTVGLAFDGLIAELLEGKKGEGEEIEARLRATGYEAPETLHLLLLDIEAYDPSHSLAQVMRDAVQESLPNVRPVVYRGQIVAVLGGEGGFAANHEALAGLLALVEKEHIRLSLSQRFFSIKQLAFYYRQAQELLSIGARVRPALGFYPYDTFGVYLMIHHCALHEDVAQFCHPALPALREYDLRNNTEHFRTLHVWLTHARSLNAAAEALFIHRNTLRYRLTKIAEITGVDLTNEALLSQFYLSYHILEYLGHM